jgi:hypothetical protein
MYTLHNLELVLRNVTKIINRSKSTRILAFLNCCYREAAGILDQKGMTIFLSIKAKRVGLYPTRGGIALYECLLNIPFFQAPDTLIMRNTVIVA